MVKKYEKPMSTYTFRLEQEDKDLFCEIPKRIRNDALREFVKGFKK